MNTIYFSIGSNLGDRKQSIKKALYYLNRQDFKIIACSSVIETIPYGYTDQYFFLNLVIKTETNHSDPSEVLRICKHIESIMGRKESVRWGPRLIDIDILFWNQDIVQHNALTIPHPDMQNRDFVILPCLEICPTYVHPVLHKTIKQLWNIYKEE
jgi:2-amino-4-hydroxy-6-hydroxymethyldihydropteridine diphosphokinase